MASKQLLRRLPLLGRERLNQLSGGAFPDVANDVLPIVSGNSAADSGPSARSPQGPVTGPVVACSTRGPQSLQKPLSTLSIAATDVARQGWPVPQQQSSPTDIAVATLPAIAGLLKQKRSLPAGVLEPSLAARKDAAAAIAAAGDEAARSAASATSAAQATASPAAIDDLVSVSTDASSLASSPVLARPPAPAPALPQPPPPQPQQLPPPPQTHFQPQPQQQRRSSSGRGNSAASSSIQLNKHIMGCRTTDELLALVQHRGAHFDYFNISTALARVPKLAATSGPPPHHAADPANAGGSRGAGGHVAPPLSSDLHVDAAGRAVLDHLSQLMVTHIGSFDARGLANSAWAFGKLKYVPTGSLPSVIAQAALRRMGEFSPQNLSNLVWSFVYMHHADEALLAAASRFVCARVGEFKPQELANIVWAFASLGHRDEQMLQVVAQQSQRIASQFKEQELSNVLWALGKMSLRNRPDVFESLMAETRAKLPAFLPQGISNVAWALASVGHADTLFLDRVVAQCGHQLGAFDVQALANLAWSMASLGYYQPAFLATVVNECLGRGLDRLSPQNLSNILWSCATLNHRDPRMLAAWAAQTLEKLASFEPQGLSNTAWAFARLGFHNPQLFSALATAALHKLDGFTAQGLSNLAWAMATAGAPQPRLFEALSRQAITLAPSFNAQNCSVTLWAAATLRHGDAALFDALLERLAAEVEAEGCEPQNLANALWAVARMGHPLPPAQASSLVLHAVRLLPRMSQQELCNTMWAVAALDLMDERLFAAFCDCLQRLPDISPEGMHQAYHAQLMFHSSLARAADVPLPQLQSLPASRQLLPRLPEPLHTVAASMWAASARDVHVSRFQQEVSGALAVAGVPHAVEWMTDDQHFSVDIGLQVNSQPTAVEVNGSHHYTSNPPHRPLGDMGQRRRLLQDRGWHVVDVGFTDWEAMGRTMAERGSNLVGRIAASMDDWDWRFVGLPQRAPGSAAPPPQAVVSAAPPAAAAAAAEAAAAAQQQQEQAALQQALAAAMGLGPLFAEAQASAAAAQAQAAQAQARAVAAAAASCFLPSASVPAGPGLSLGGLGGLGLGLGSSLDGSWASLGLSQLAALGGQIATGAAASGAATAQRATSLGLGGLDNDDAVAAAVEAAEALGALPGGNLLLAQQMYSVLGVSLPPSAAELGQLSAFGGLGGGPLASADSGMLRGSGGSGTGGSSEEGEEMVVSDDDLERVVQFTLA
ncbi:hypothetical protein GPECTOR_31g346 [Gonium pectorale]|uniref:RAP domain-containing protein n=1 Tax=Gonium pectorale TaxID=33097 RepID=A0A150GDR9_GONPE|nr:hypothetical protein GPECTOR_31g346 [Gonium pectorale]|eukprot:KXZ47984.1 hypothetical protein GPECTOR_31g346 [Gonium pectorale]